MVFTQPAVMQLFPTCLRFCPTFRVQSLVFGSRGQKSSCSFLEARTSPHPQLHQHMSLGSHRLERCLLTTEPGTPGGPVGPTSPCVEMTHTSPPYLLSPSSAGPRPPRGPCCPHKSRGPLPPLGSGVCSRHAGPPSLLPREFPRFPASNSRLCIQTIGALFSLS